MKSVSKNSKDLHISSANSARESIYFDEATKKKIQRHLTDINDHITEEDIKNIDTNITTSSAVRDAMVKH